MDKFVLPDISRFSENEQKIIENGFLYPEKNYDIFKPKVILCQHYFTVGEYEKSEKLAEEIIIESKTGKEILDIGCYFRKNLMYKLSKIFLEKVSYFPNSSKIMGRMYQKGLGVPQNYDIALYYYRKALIQKNNDSFIPIGVFYEKGVTEFAHIDEEERYRTAFNYYMKAALKNNTWGCEKIAQMYENGLYVRQNYALANEWYKKTDKGKAFHYYHNIARLYEIGQYYENGIQQPVNMEKAIELYKIGIENECRHSLYRFGQLYLEGKYFPQDVEKAKEFLRLAAKREMIPAKDLLNSLGENFEYI